MQALLFTCCAHRLRTARLSDSQDFAGLIVLADQP